MMDRIKRWRWAILITALLAAGLAYSLWPEAVAVDTEKVSRGEMSVGITDDGVTRAEELYVVSAPVTGYLSRIELEAGDTVNRGALITRMTGRPSISAPAMNSAVPSRRHGLRKAEQARPTHSRSATSSGHRRFSTEGSCPRLSWKPHGRGSHRIAPPSNRRVRRSPACRQCLQTPAAPTAAVL